jgi:peptidyl-prolyl cis-trans isomerase C
MSVTPRFLATLLLLATPAAFAGNTLLTVNGKAVDRAQLDFVIKEQVRQGRPASPELARQAREELVTREVLAQEAERRLGDSESLRTRIDFMRQQALVNALREDFFLRTQPADAEVRKIYDDLTARAGEREYRVRHILLESEDQAKALLAQIGKGARFEDLAKIHSKDTDSAAAGGLLDWTVRGQFAPAFAAVLPQLTRGRVSEAPVQTSAGWHLIRLDDVRAAAPPRFDDVKPRIVEALIEQKWRQYVKDLQAGAVVR